MLCIHKGGRAARALALRNRAEREGGFPRGFRPVDLHDPSLGQAAKTERDVEAQGPGGYGRNSVSFVVTQAHDAALAELALNLPKRRLQRFLLVLIHRRSPRSSG